MNHRNIQTAFFLVFFIGIGVLMFFLLKPFITPLIIAFTLAILFYPLFRKLTRMTHGRKRIAALLNILVIIVVVMGPLLFFGVQVFNEGKDFYFKHLVGNQPLQLVPEQLEPYLGSRYAAFQENFSTYLQQGLIWLLEHVGVIFSSITHLIFTMFLTLLALYYLFVHGSDFKARIIALSPLSDHYDRDITDKLQLAVTSVIKGVLVVAVVQAILCGLGFAIFGIPNAALWGSIAMIAALIPAFGTALVMIPAVLYLAITGNVGAALGLAVWGALLVGLVDNFLSPMLMSRSIKIHNFFILLSVLGGLALFGPVGFIAGPLVLSLFFALLDIYPTLILHEKAPEQTIVQS